MEPLQLVLNNPLALMDPNGYCFLGMCSWGKAISTFFGRTFGVQSREFPILENLFEMAAVALCSRSHLRLAVGAYRSVRRQSTRLQSSE